MCKYCRLTVCSESIGEMTNENGLFARVRDGSQIIECGIYRDICESDKAHSNDLLLTLDVNIDGCVYNVKSKRIKIKYYPFCGEEL